MSFVTSYHRFDLVTATFSPKKTDDLKPGVADWIERWLVWQASWVIDDGPYEGQMAFLPHADPYSPREYLGWVPECDLKDIVLKSRIR